jgi:hypothetical protein
MRVSWAIGSFPGKCSRGDRPPEKRKADSSILSLTTTSNQGKHLLDARMKAVLSSQEARSTSAAACRGSAVPSFPAARSTSAKPSSGGTVDFSDAKDWSFPPAFSWLDTPSPGVKLPKLA